MWVQGAPPRAEDPHAWEGAVKSHAPSPFAMTGVLSIGNLIPVAWVEAPVQASRVGLRVGS